MRASNSVMFGSLGGAVRGGADYSPWSCNHAMARPNQWRTDDWKRSARPASFRPQIRVGTESTRVLAEQTAAVDASRLGELAGHLTPQEQWGVDLALTLVMGLP